MGCPAWDVSGCRHVLFLFGGLDLKMRRSGEGQSVRLSVSAFMEPIFWFVWTCHSDVFQMIMWGSPAGQLPANQRWLVEPGPPGPPLPQVEFAICNVVQCEVDIQCFRTKLDISVE